MGISYSQNYYKNIKEVDTLCFNMNVYENDLSKLFYNIVSIIQTHFDIDSKILCDEKLLNNYTNTTNNNYNNNNNNNNCLHIHFEFQNILFEIKLVKEEKIYSLGFIQVKLKIFTQKNDKENKDKFNNFCSDCVKTFTSQLQLQLQLQLPNETYD